jgi:hypothetical protein
MIRGHKSKATEVTVTESQYLTFKATVVLLCGPVFVKHHFEPSEEEEEEEEVSDD